jgi:hypothetical protein
MLSLLVKNQLILSGVLSGSPLALPPMDRLSVSQYEQIFKLCKTFSGFVEGNYSEELDF